MRRRLDQAGFSEKALPLEKVFHGIFGMPKTWKFYDKILLETSKGGVMIMHGDERGSSCVPLSAMRKVGYSLIRGHYHSRFFLAYESTSEQLRFDMIVGCGIDPKSIAYTYNRKDLARPILGCAVLIDGEPRLKPMWLDKNGKWTGKIL